MLPSALISQGKFADFYEDPKAGGYVARTYLCRHREKWIFETGEWLLQYNIEWEFDKGFVKLAQARFIDKNTWIMFKLAFDGSFPGRCGF
jgi:hypothetical protein